jgi:DnaJ-class molecular chaperone
MTFDQIEDARDSLSRGGDGKPCLSLQQAADNVGLPFEQCPECKGNGWTTATLLVSMMAIEALAKACPNDPVPIQYERCNRCHGSGGWLLPPYR